MEGLLAKAVTIDGEMEAEAGRFARGKVGTNAEMCSEDPVHFGHSNSSSRLKEMVCREEELKNG